MKKLIITTIGEYNHADQWLNGGAHDVFLINYDMVKTFKYKGIYKALMDHDLLCYDYYWLPDEDISINGCDISRMFDLMEEHNIDLAQPSIEDSVFSFPSWDRFIHDKDKDDIIPTDFVEVMCPMFSYNALLLCLPTFNKTLSGWGIDLVWSKLLKDKNMDVAIINSVVAKHTRRLNGSGLYDALKENGVMASRERKEMMRQYGITEHSILKK